jgi:hypothetical protein
MSLFIRNRQIPYLSSKAAITSVLATALLILSVAGCGDSPADPESSTPDFHIAYVQFTGDSTGAGNPARAVPSRIEIDDPEGTPFCQITVGWFTPEVDSILAYVLFRSLEPGVQESGQATIIATTSDTLVNDSYQLDWGTSYYYAVRALDQDSTELWSDEASILTPNSQIPTPSVLSAIDLPMGQCILHWTICPDDDFSSYILLRDTGSSMLSPDTLGVFTDVADTTCSDVNP